MIYIAIFIPLVFFLANLIIEKRLISPESVFNLVWLLALFLIAINPFGLNAISNTTLTLLTIGNVVFNVSSYFFSLFFTNKSKVIKDYSNKTKYRTNLLFMFILILLILMLPPFLKSLAVLISGGFAAVRTFYVSGANGFDNAVIRLLYVHVLIFPAAFVASVLAAHIWIRGKLGFIQFMFSVLLIIMLVVITGARLYLLSYMIFFGISFFMNFELDKNSIKNRGFRRVLFVIVLTFITILYYVTKDRGISGGNNIFSILKTFYVYFVGGISVFNNAINNQLAYGLGDYTYGATFVAGILQIIAYPLSKISMLSNWTFYPTDAASEYLVRFVSIGSNTEMNAFATMYYFFMRDFGVFGIVLYSTILAMLCSFVKHMLSKRNNLVYNQIYIYVIGLIAFSTIWWDLYRMESWSILILLILASNLIEKKERSLTIRKQAKC